MPLENAFYLFFLGLVKILIHIKYDYHEYTYILLTICLKLKTGLLRMKWNKRKIPRTEKVI